MATESLIVDAQGLPQKVQIIRYLKTGLDEETLAAVKRYKFKPAALNGKPVPVEVNLQIKLAVY